MASLRAVCAQRWSLVKIVEGKTIQVPPRDSVVFRCTSQGEVTGRAYVNYFSVQARRDVDDSIEWYDYDKTAIYAPQDVAAQETHWRELWLATDRVEHIGRNMAMVSFNGHIRLEFEPTSFRFEFEPKQ